MRVKALTSVPCAGPLLPTLISATLPPSPCLAHHHHMHALMLSSPPCATLLLKSAHNCYTQMVRLRKRTRREAGVPLPSSSLKSICSAPDFLATVWRRLRQHVCLTPPLTLHLDIVRCCMPSRCLFSLACWLLSGFLSEQNDVQGHAIA